MSKITKVKIALKIYTVAKECIYMIIYLLYMCEFVCRYVYNCVNTTTVFTFCLVFSSISAEQCGQGELCSWDLQLMWE